MPTYANLFHRLTQYLGEPPADQLETTGCSAWTGNLHAKGYGRLTVRRNGKHMKLLAHRAIEQVYRQAEAQREADDAAPLWGPLPPEVSVPELDTDEQTLDHHCFCPSCGNVDHWEVVTRSVNSKRRWLPTTTR